MTHLTASDASPHLLAEMYRTLSSYQHAACAFLRNYFAELTASILNYLKRNNLTLPKAQDGVRLLAGKSANQENGDLSVLFENFQAIGNTLDIKNSDKNIVHLQRSLFMILN